MPPAGELKSMKKVSKYSGIGGVYLFFYKEKIVFILVHLLIYTQDLKAIRLIVPDLIEEEIVNFINF